MVLKSLSWQHQKGLHLGGFSQMKARPCPRDSMRYVRQGLVWSQGWMAKWGLHGGWDKISWSHKLPLISRGLGEKKKNKKPKPEPKNYSSCLLLDVILWPHALRNTIKPLVSWKEIILANTQGPNQTGQKKEEVGWGEREADSEPCF